MGKLTNNKFAQKKEQRSEQSDTTKNDTTANDTFSSTTLHLHLHLLIKIPKHFRLGSTEPAEDKGLPARRPLSRGVAVILDDSIIDEFSCGELIAEKTNQKFLVSALPLTSSAAFMTSKSYLALRHSYTTWIVTSGCNVISGGLLRSGCKPCEDNSAWKKIEKPLSISSFNSAILSTPTFYPLLIHEGDDGCGSEHTRITPIRRHAFPFVFSTKETERNTQTPSLFSLPIR